MRKTVTERVVTIVASDCCGGFVRIDDNGGRGHELGVPIAVTVGDEKGEEIYLSLTPGQAKRLAVVLNQTVKELE